MSSGKIQTVLGCIEPKDLGVTLTHEHLSMIYDFAFKDPPKREQCNTNTPLHMNKLGWVRQFPYATHANLMLREEEAAVMEEMIAYKASGGSSIVENSIIGLDRNMAFLVEVSQRTGLNIVAGTGFYFEDSQKASVLSMSHEEQVKRMTSDLTSGWEGSDVKCGVIGEVGCSWPLTKWERGVLRATAEAQASTGCPVIIHPGRQPEAPEEIIRVLQEAGGDVSRTVMSHLDRTFVNTEQFLEFAALGCISELDLFGIEVTHYMHNNSFNMPNDGQRLSYIRALLDEGYGANVVMAHDVHTKHRLTKYGGHGYSHILQNIVPMMRTRGFTQEEIDQILIHTPTRWLTLK